MGVKLFRVGVFCADPLSPMRTKGMALLLTCIVASSVLVCLFSNQRPTLHTILSETHKQLDNLKNLKENLKVGERRELTTDEKYLVALGFTAHPRVFPDGWGKNVTQPVITTGAIPGQLDNAIGLVTSAKHFLPDHSLLVYDLGLDEDESIALEKFCNATPCTVIKFDFTLFPNHISDLSLSAYTPLVIQDALNRVGAVLWLDSSCRITSGNLDAAVQRARKTSLVSWSIDQPTSALTHPRMFQYFHTQPENYYFHRMVEPAHLLVYNTARIHTELMQPWVTCSLISECIAPIGAQSTGCRFDKKPMYRYSGCHRYDMSAFNVVLGIIFNYDASPYIAEEKFFRSLVKMNPSGNDASAYDNATYPARTENADINI